MVDRLDRLDCGADGGGSPGLRARYPKKFRLQYFFANIFSHAEYFFAVKQKVHFPQTKKN